MKQMQLQLSYSLLIFPDDEAKMTSSALVLRFKMFDISKMGVSPAMVDSCCGASSAFILVPTIAILQIGYDRGSIPAILLIDTLLE